MRAKESLTQAVEDFLAAFDAAPRIDKIRPAVATLREVYLRAKEKRKAGSVAGSQVNGRPKLDRSIIHRMHAQGFTVADIAKAAGCSLETVRRAIKEQPPE